MSNARNFLLIAIVCVSFLLWQAWQQDHAQTLAAPPAPTSDAVPEGAVAPATGAATNSAEVPDAPTATANAATPAATHDAPSTSPRVTVSSDVLRLTIDTQGGNVVSADLLTYPITPKDREHPVQLLSDAADTFYVAQSGLINADHDAPDHRALYRAEATSYTLADGADTVEVPLTWTNDAGITVTKRFVLTRGSYAVHVHHQVRNDSAAPYGVSVYRQLQRSAPIKSSRFSITNPEQYSFVGAAWYSPEEKFEKLAFDKFEKTPLKREITGGWSALQQHYFFSAWIPDAAEKAEYSTQVVTQSATPRYLIRQMSPLTTVAPGASADLDARLYIGPKLQKHLGEIAPGLALTVDYGRVTIIAEPLYIVLSFIHKLVGNWGWSIVLITLLLKLLLYPLSEAQYRSMAKMRKMAPRLQALKERYGDDRQKLNQATMELYQKEKINPLGGCLPLLVQIPVFIALYWVLIESVELRQAPFIGWIQNLSDKDPYFVLPVLNGLAMFLGQRLTPMTGMDPMQQRIMQMMPIVFSVMFAFFPAGLVLYWTVNGTLSLAQQWFIMRRVDDKPSKA